MLWSDMPISSSLVFREDGRSIKPTLQKVSSKLHFIGQGIPYFDTALCKKWIKIPCFPSFYYGPFLKRRIRYKHDILIVHTVRKKIDSF